VSGFSPASRASDIGSAGSDHDGTSASGTAVERSEVSGGDELTPHAARSSRHNETRDLCDHADVMGDLLLRP